MTINQRDDRIAYTRALVDDGLGGVVDRPTYQGRVEDDFEQMGFLYTDENNIPSSATIRVAGEFTDAYDAMSYLEIGGLTAADDQGDLVPIGFVYFFQYYDSDLDEYFYQVWIDEDTG